MQNECERPLLKVGKRGRSTGDRGGFTLVELLLVMVIIVILIGTVIAVGHSQVEKAKRRETAGLLDTLRLAAAQFAEEKPLRQVRGYWARYGSYPADELDGFLSSEGIPGSGESIAPGGSDLRVPDNNNLAIVHNGDIKAFALAVRSYSEKGAAILDRIPSKYRAPAARDPASGDVLEYLDRDDSDTFTAGDEPLDYFIDAWGTPIAYFATRPSNNYSVWDRDTSNVQTAGDRRRTCGALLSLSNDVPVFVSYGPDGPEQFNDDFRELGQYRPDLIYDLNEKPPKAEFKFDHPLNTDNVYSNETVRDKILLMDIPEGQPI